MIAFTANAQTNPQPGIQRCYYLDGGVFYTNDVSWGYVRYAPQYQNWCAEDHTIGDPPARYDHAHFPDPGFPYDDYGRSPVRQVSQTMANNGWDNAILGSYAPPGSERRSSATFGTNCHNYALGMMDMPCIAATEQGVSVCYNNGEFQWVDPPVTDGFLCYVNHSYKLADETFEVAIQGPPVTTYVTKWRLEKNASSGVYYRPHMWYYWPVYPYWTIPEQYCVGNNAPNP